MKILLTGSNGNLGKDIYKYLKSSGYNIIGLDIDQNFTNNDYLSCDLRDFKKLEDIICCEPHIDAIVHLAAKISFSSQDRSIFDVNTLGTFNLAYLAEKYKIKKIINLSSIQICEDSQDIINESNCIDNPRTLYHHSKMLGEKMLVSPIYNYSSIIFRIASPITTTMNNNTFFPMIIQKAINNDTLTLYGSGGRIQNYIDSRDISFAIIEGLKRDISGLFFLSGVSISNKDLAERVIERTNSKSTIDYSWSDFNDDNQKWLISNKKWKGLVEKTSCFSIEDMIDKLIESLRLK
jgi:nucleoside-diphosphate-sugar epimerase